MELMLEVMSSERHMLGERASHRFLPAGGVIGRSSECDWSLPDQTRHLSGRHAIISYEAGQFFITDISTNGVYLNGPDPLPKNIAVALNDEDRLVMGEFQMRVRVSMDYNPARPVVPTPSRPAAPVLGQGPLQADHSDNPMAAVDAFLADRLQQDAAAQEQQDWHRQSVSMPDDVQPEREVFTPPQARPGQPVSPPADGGLPEDWMDPSVVPMPDKPAGETPVQAVPVAQPSVPPVSAPPAPENAGPAIPRPGGAPRPDPMATVEAPAQSFAGPAPQAPRQSDAIAAFAKGLGLTAREIEQAGGDAFMQRAGSLLRLCLQGLVANAHARASLKNEFRLDMTLVNARDNNPIKFSASAEQVLRHMVAPEQGSFLSVEDAVEECVEDFQQHQLAMMAGMQRAFLELIQQLSPDELERRFERLKSRGVAFSSKGSRYWEAYRELHQELQEEDDIFAAMFAEPFARAYDEQIRKLKHSGKKKGK